FKRRLLERVRGRREIKLTNAGDVFYAEGKYVLLCYDQLNEQDFVLFERDIPTRKATDKILKNHGVVVHKVAEFDNIETIKRAVEVGFGLAIVPRPSVLDEQKSGQLKIISLAESEWKRSVGIIHRTDRTLSIAAKKFVQLLTATEEKPASDKTKVTKPDASLTKAI
ncbi:MAG: LysR family transcriptional regulator substrate-binding protein, partial [Pyrinomonadaceae bacterium]|nr:LysR family transcriptional regulator substrate-binding protein [Pyrinomonadaceae bacterium]